MLSERGKTEQNHYTKECILKEDNECLKDLNNYIPNLLKYLWENPKIVSVLLANSEIKDLKDNLAPFIVNNFFENILSSNYIEDNLMYVLALMLKEEINDLKDINAPESFLNETSHCGYLLYELRRKNDVQYFFRTLILNVINDLEVISSETFNLNVNSIIDICNKARESKEKDSKNKDQDANIILDCPGEIFKKSINTQNDYQNLNHQEIKNKKIRDEVSKKLDEFSSRYLASLTMKEIKNQMEVTYINDNNMKNYCKNQLINCEKEKDDNYYSNSMFLNNIYYNKADMTGEILYYYQKDFFQITEFLQQILTNLAKNIYLLPYSVKCLCKIISILIEKQFPDINITQKNAFIASFFFKKLINPILTNPGEGVLINNFIISNNTIKNLEIINTVLEQLVSGKFFLNRNSDYSAFNWYFLEKMPEIIKLFEDLTKVRLPSFIEELLYDKLDKNYKYDYFKENPDEIMYHRSICFNLYNIDSIINSLDKCKNKIFINDGPGKIFQKTFEKLNSNKNRKLINDLKNIDKKNPKASKQKEMEKEKINYYLIMSLVTNDKYKELFNMNLDKNPNYTIKELKKTICETDIINNNIIKVKNFISSLLYNYRKLIITEFEEGTMTNTLNILKVLKTFIKSSNYVVDVSIPSEWYIDSLIGYLNKIPEDLQKNDFSKLYEEIEEEVNLAIKKLDFEILSVCLDKLKYTIRGKNYYEEAIKSTQDLALNEKVKNIIEEEYIPVEIIFKYNNVQKIFDIVKSKIKEKEYIKKISKSTKKNNLCNNIRTFTEKFPNLSIYQEMQDIDLFDMQKELCIPDKMETYFNLIKDNLISSKKYTNSLEIEEISNKINDYIMNKIYDKIFPKTDTNDDKIFNKSVMLSWTEPKHFIPGKTNYVFDSFLPEVIDYFKSMDKVKSPMKKISYMNDIFNSISKVVKFNGGDDDTGVDDQMPILNYAFVKAQPMRINSNIKLMELYIGEMKSKKEGSELTQLIATCDFVIHLNYNNLNGVSQEDFVKNCNSAALGLT